MRLEKSWHEALSEELKKPYIQQLKQFVGQERLNSEVFPPEALVFRAFLYAPYDKVKVVIVGQDPYHGPGQAHGLSFSVPLEVAVPPSLRNIYKELQEDLGIHPAKHGNLESWAKQGVLLLNATLTVKRGAPKSHYGQGWEEFTNSIIRKLADRDDPVIFVLWGRSAYEKCEKVLTPADFNKHYVLSAAHPSPFSAHKFLGCKHFSKINAKLKEWGKEPINWDVNEAKQSL